MKTAQVLQRLDDAWTAFEDSYAGLPEERLLAPGVTTWWEEEALEHLPLVREGGRPPRYSVRYGGIDAFNAQMTEARRGLTLADVLRQHDEVHARLVDYVRRAPEELFARETRFRRRLRLDTFGHYPIHTRAIRAWRSRDGV